MQCGLKSGKIHYLLLEYVDDDIFFESGDDYRYCFNQIIELSTIHEVGVYAWRLLPDEMHILAGSDGPINDISRFMKALACRMTVGERSEFRFPWHVKFRCCPVEEGPWILACMRYIESVLNEDDGQDLNEDIARARNSYYLRAAQGRRWLLDFPRQYRKIGRTEDERFETYYRYMRDGVLEREREAIYRALRLSEPIGSEIFAHRCRKRNGVSSGNSSNGDG